jgi:protein-disulfide isomerase
VKKILTYIAVIAVIVLGVWWLNSGDDSTSNGKPPTNRTYGNGSSGVVLTEYGDFECPGCGAFFPIVQQIKEEYKDKITFQFRHFPLINIHQNAQAAHRASEAADKQGKFWEMHDLLYQNQQSWAGVDNVAGIFEEFARQLGLNIDQYKGDVISPDVNDNIQADLEAGKALGVSGTPTFFLDGKQIEDNRDIDTIEKFKAKIDAAIAAKTGQPAPETNAESKPEEAAETTNPESQTSSQ